MTALRSMLVWDVRLQVQYGFYAVYAVLTAAFVLGLRMIGSGLRTDAAVLLIVTDPTILGFYFIAALVLFEKREGVLDALVVSPLGDRGYLASKVLSLSLLAAVAAALVAVVGHGAPSRITVLVVGVVLASSLFVLIGFVAVSRFDSVNQYFLSAVGWGTVVFLPLFGYVGLVETPLFYALPAQPVLLLVEGGFRPIARWELLYAVGYLVVANGIGYVWARRMFRRHIVRGGDSGRQLGRNTVSEQRARDARWSPWAGLVLADFRNWVRDPMLGIAAVGPLVLAVCIRIGEPVITDLTTPVFELSSYYPLITGSMTVFGPQIYGFIVGMFILEDRELGVLTAYRTSPLSGRRYLLYRGLTAYVSSLVATLPALVVIDLTSVPPAVIVGTAVVGALGGPLIAFVLATTSANTIEGLALSKLLNLVVIGPALVIAVVPEPLQFVSGVVPMYWPVKAFVAGAGGDPAWVWYLLAGIVAHTLVGTAVGWWFTTRTD